jgi:hypothetical protein
MTKAGEIVGPDVMKEPSLKRPLSLFLLLLSLCFLLCILLTLFISIIFLTFSILWGWSVMLSVPRS